VWLVCRVLTEQGCRVSPRTYREWKHPTRPVSARQVQDEAILDKLRWTVTGDDPDHPHPQPESLYGRRKMTRWLRRVGFPHVAFCTVDRLMRHLGMNGVRRGRVVRTTIPGKDGTRAGDLVDRDFTAPAPNTRLVADFTYVRTWAGFVYVSFAVDCYAQRIVGWDIRTDKTTALVLHAVQMAVWARSREHHAHTPQALIHHSDAGSQYTSITFTEHLALEGILPSIGSVGDAYDNALMESVIGLFKAEAIRPLVFHPGPLKDLTDVEHATGRWVHWWNTQRLHSTIGYQTPLEAETQYYEHVNN